MIYLSTNRPRYAGELCEVLRIFFGMAEITEIEQFGESPALNAGDLLACCSISDENAWSEVKTNSECFRADDAYLSADLCGTTDELLVKKYEKRALKSTLYRALSQCTKVNAPWGALTGIRPTRLAREFGEDAGAILRNRFYVSDEKTELALSIIKEQEAVLASQRPNDFDVYIGIPFCATRCSYCSFAAYELGKGLATRGNVERYVEVLCDEIKQSIAFALGAGFSLRSVYIGGGTPTALTCDQLERVICALRESVRVCCEFTVEAGRPDTIDRQKLAMLRRHGVNRISINPQTMNDETLKAIGRSHSPDDVIRAFYEARDAGFECVNMDTIIGLPGETSEHVKRTMDRLMPLSPENLTVHTLAIKRSSRLKTQLDKTPLPDSAEAEAMLHTASCAAKAMGMRPYYMYRQKYMRGNLENVGYSKPNYASVYNVDIMEETTNIMALGAGAITKWIYDNGARIERCANPKDLKTYFEKSDAMRAEREKLMLSAIATKPVMY